MDLISKEGGFATWSHDMLNIMENIFKTPSSIFYVQQAC